MADIVEKLAVPVEWHNHNNCGRDRDRGRKGLDGKDAAFLQGNSLHNAIHSEGTSLHGEIAGATRAIMGQVSSQGDSLHRAVAQDTRSVEAAVHREGNALQQSIDSDTKFVAEAVRDEGRMNLKETSDGSRYVAGEVRGEARLLQKTIDDDTRFVENTVRSEGRFLQKSLDDDTRSIEREVRSGDRSIEHQVRAESRWLEDEVEDNARENRENAWRINKNVSEGRLDVAKEACETRATVGRVGAGINDNLCEGFGDVKNQLTGGFKDQLIESKVAQLQLCNSTDKIVETVTKRTHWLEVQAVNFAKDAALAAKEQMALSNQLAYQANLEAVKNATAAALAAKDLSNQADRNMAAMMKAQDDCCCELKERIAADGQKTRDLINEQARLEAVRRELKLEAEITYLKGRLVPGIPV